jgi:LPXTG-site transpeptidase (sortase) family protein
MSEKPLLLSSAKTGVLAESYRPSHWWRTIAIAFGVLAVLVGAADVMARISREAFGNNASFMAFAPAAALIDPSLLTPAALPLATTSVSSLTPIRLQVPALGIDAKVESVGKKSDGSMGTPSTWQNVAWYDLGPKPGEPGNAVIDGHVDNALTTAGVFQHLSQIGLGDVVEVSDAEGHQLRYSVSAINEYAVNGAPTGSIFATSGPSQLVLITCDGNWDASLHEFDKRLVVVARLIGS